MSPGWGDSGTNRGTAQAVASNTSASAWAFSPRSRSFAYCRVISAVACRIVVWTLASDRPAFINVGVALRLLSGIPRASLFRRCARTPVTVTEHAQN